MSTYRWPRYASSQVVRRNPDYPAVRHRDYAPATAIAGIYGRREAVRSRPRARGSYSGGAGPNSAPNGSELFKN